MSQEEVGGVGVGCLVTHKVADGSIPGSSQPSVDEVSQSKAAT